jgi:hypothetical protein
MESGRDKKFFLDSDIRKALDDKLQIITATLPKFQHLHGFISCQLLSEVEHISDPKGRSQGFQYLRVTLKDAISQLRTSTITVVEEMTQLRLHVSTQKDVVDTHKAKVTKQAKLVKDFHEKEDADLGTARVMGDSFTMDVPLGAYAVDFLNIPRTITAERLLEMLGLLNLQPQGFRDVTKGRGARAPIFTVGFLDKQLRHEAVLTLSGDKSFHSSSVLPFVFPWLGTYRGAIVSPVARKDILPDETQINVSPPAVSATNLW